MTKERSTFEAGDAASEMRGRYDECMPQFKSASPAKSYEADKDEANNVAQTISSPHTTDMGDITRDEVKSRLEASEARVEAALAGMRADNSKSLAEMSIFRADVASTLSRIESAIKSQNSAMDAYSDRIDAKLSGLKIWVLSGALAGVIALLSVIVSGIIRYAAPGLLGGAPRETAASVTVKPAETSIPATQVKEQAAPVKELPAPTQKH